MKPEFIELIGNARRRRGLTFRNQLSVFLVCLLIAVLLWMSVKLSREYYHSIDYRIRVSGVPPTYSLVGVSDSIFSIKIKLQGYDYITDRLFHTGMLMYDLDVSGIRIRWQNGEYRGFILTNPIGHDITSRSRFQQQFVSTVPDTLYFTFERKR